MQLIGLALPPSLKEGDALSRLVFEAAQAQAGGIRHGDLVVVAQKAVSKTEGSLVGIESVEAGPKARELAMAMGRDPRLIEVILSESTEVLRCTAHVIITRHKTGVVLANAGVDRSNVPQPGTGEWVVTWPRDPDASARRLCEEISRAVGAHVPVIVNDSLGRAWRRGTIGQAIGAYGLVCLDDLRGEEDLYGYRLVSSEVAVADELAAAASAVMGQGAEGTPAVLVRGFRWKPSGTAPLEGGSAADLIRPLQEDLFR